MKTSAKTHRTGIRYRIETQYGEILSLAPTTNKTAKYLLCKSVGKKTHFTVAESTQELLKDTASIVQFHTLTMKLLYL